jgi:hypothetical protein
MNIVDFIPLGEDNAVTRDELCQLTGLQDRFLREAISQARRNEAILNFGKGYFRPRANEIGRVEVWCKQERARAKSIFWSMKGANKLVKEKDA